MSGATRGQRSALALVAVVTTLGLLGACGQKVVGRASAVGDIDPGSVAGLPVTEGPSGLKPGVPEAQMQVENADNGEMDKIAVNAVADVDEFWKTAIPANFPGHQFDPVKRLVSYDSAGKGLTICRTDTAGMVNAFYCPLDDSISWDRGKLLPDLNTAFGPMSVVTVLAHEMGHAVQHKLGPASNVNQSTPTIVLEQQADCYAGAFFRSVAEGKSTHFQISTGTGINSILATMFSIRDPAGADFTKKQAHGNAFDRVSAFQFGFSEGGKRCAKIDVKEIQTRITELAFAPEDTLKGNLPIDENSLRYLQESLNQAFKDSGAPPPVIKAGAASCGKDTSPATYCPNDNTVALNMDELTAIGTPTKGKKGGIGDFAAFAEIASRYALSVQKAVGLPLDDKNAGLRTACLVGAWGGVTLERPLGGRPTVGKLRMSPGDLDEAIAELLSEGGLIAADVNGTKVGSGFARVEAFRIGFTQGSSPCTAKFS